VGDREASIRNKILGGIIRLGRGKRGLITSNRGKSIGASGALKGGKGGGEKKRKKRKNFLNVITQSLDGSQGGEVRGKRVV